MFREQGYTLQGSASLSSQKKRPDKGSEPQMHSHAPEHSDISLVHLRLVPSLVEWAESP